MHSAQEIVDGIRAGDLELITKGEETLRIAENYGPTHLPYNDRQLEAIQTALEKLARRSGPAGQRHNILH